MCKSLQMQGVSLLQLLYATTAHERVNIYFQIENAKECLLSANLNVHTTQVGQKERSEIHKKNWLERKMSQCRINNLERSCLSKGINITAIFL